jgi:hypothetical protein
MQHTTGAQQLPLKMKVAMVAEVLVMAPLKPSSLSRSMWLVEGVQVLGQAHTPVGMQADSVGVLIRAAAAVRGKQKRSAQEGMMSLQWVR